MASQTWNDIQVSVASNLGKYPNGVIDAGVLREIWKWANEFQLRTQKDRNYWFLKTRATISLVQGTRQYSMFPNYTDGAVLYLKFLAPNTPGYVEMYRISEEDRIRIWTPDDTSVAQGQPTHYMLDSPSDGTLEVFPTADKAYTMEATYWQDIGDPGNGAAGTFTNFWIKNYPDLYTAELTKKGFSYLQQWTSKTAWEAMAKGILTDLRKQNVARVLGMSSVLAPRGSVFGTTQDVKGSSRRGWVLL